ncbi:2-dehydro-3-deoxygluconokinase [bacterium BMS3Abin05]|nr:2-dehydro-3-deoxygluconokinase [bacterium BMS3Abin05]GBE28971.1 2-dehydro-3-deoxygluconokinase [bacterium BMS3Bbin03]HDZ11283.1 carbohydrate kinase [Bacteroidota bacterium]
MKKMVGLGEILWDVYPDERHLGGATANVAFHAANLGEEAIVVSRVGEDAPGAALIDILKSKRFYTGYIQRDPRKPTGCVKIHLDENGVPSFECGWDEAFDYLEWTGPLENLAGSADAVFFGILAQRMPGSRATIQKFLDAAPRALKVFDPNLRDFTEEIWPVLEASLQKANLLKINEDEEKTLRSFYRKEALSTEAFLGWLLMTFKLDAIYLTLGERGAFCCSKKGNVYAPGFRIHPVDTTGSGDAFMAAVVVEWLREVPLREILEFANAVGAYVATKEGAVPAYTRSEILKFKHTRSEKNGDPDYYDLAGRTGRHWE